MIGVVGLSHLGLVTAATMCAKGFPVVVFDKNSRLIEQAQQGTFSIFEEGLDDLLSNPNLSFTSDIHDLGKCKLLYLARDVETNDSNVSDVSTVESLLGEMIEIASHECTLIVHCQIPPGFMGRNISLHRDKIGEKSLTLFYQVETLIFGRAVDRALNPERIIVGCSNPSDPLPNPYKSLLDKYNCPVLQMRYESAELAKIAINVYLVSSITTTNLLSETCEKMGGDWREIEQCLRLDKRIGQYAYISPGLGIAGGNLERDLVTLSGVTKEQGVEAEILTTWHTNLTWRKNWIIRTLAEQVFSKNRTPTVAVWGIAYKPGTLSTKNSPTSEILQLFSDYSFRIHDPMVKLTSVSDKVQQIDDALETCRNADVLLIMTPWDEYKTKTSSTILSYLRGKVIIDPFRAVKRDEDEQSNLSYHALGLSDHRWIS